MNNCANCRFYSPSGILGHGLCVLGVTRDGGGGVRDDFGCTRWSGKTEEPQSDLEGGYQVYYWLRQENAPVQHPWIEDGWCREKNDALDRARKLQGEGFQVRLARPVLW